LEISSLSLHDALPISLSFALSTSTLAIACPAVFENVPAGVVTIPIVWATAAPISNGAHRTTVRSDFMIDSSSWVGGLGRHFFCGDRKSTRLNSSHEWT